MPEGTVDVIPVDLVVAAIIAVAAGPDPDEPADHPGGLGLGQPAALPAPRRPGAELLHRAPDLRRRGPADHRARVVLPRPRPGAAPARAGQVALDQGRDGSSRPSRCGASRPTGPPRSRRSGRRSSGPSPTSSSTAPTPSARPSTASTACSPAGTSSTRDDQADVLLRPPRHRLEPLRRRTSTCRRWSSTPGCRTTPGGAPGREARGPPAPPGARPRTPPRRVRPREHAHRVQRRGVVLVAGHPPAPPRGPGPVRAPDAPRGAGAAGRSTARTAATSSATSTAATRAPTSPSSRPTPSRCSATSSSPSRSRPRSAGCASTGALGHRTVLITGALDFVVEPLRPAVRRHRRARRSPAGPTAPTAASSPTCPPTGEARAQALFDYAATHGFDLAESRRLRRLDLRPADARGGRLPGRREPRDPPRRAGPQAGLAGRALRQGARRAAAAAAHRPRVGPPRAAGRVAARSPTAAGRPR